MYRLTIRYGYEEYQKAKTLYYSNFLNALFSAQDAIKAGFMAIIEPVKAVAIAQGRIAA